jgi:hypothetical protein
MSLLRSIKPRIRAMTLFLSGIAFGAILISACATLASFQPDSKVVQVGDAQNAATIAQTMITSTTSPTHTAPPTSSATTQPSSTPSPAAFWDGPIVIGESVAGRPIEVYRFGTGPRKLLIIGGIHGGYEYNTITLTEQLISLLRGRPEWIPEDVTLFILRSLNPDGEARAQGIHGRINENGVDLNRNFPAQWKLEWPIDGCWRYLPVTGGPYPASEPETLALMQFLIDEDIFALINYHSAALGIFPGGQPPFEASISLAEAVAAVSDYPYPPVDTGCLFTGQLIDWASMQGIAAIDIELANHRDSDLKVNLEILHVFLHWQP